MSITLENINAMLLEQSIQTGKELAYEDAEQMIQPLIDLLEMDPEKKAIIDGLVHLKGDYPIDAEVMLKELEALANDADSAKTKRMLERAKIIPKGLKFEARPVGRSSNNEPFVAYSNMKCQIVRLSEKGENGKTYYPIKYKLTINAAHKVLMRAYNDDTFADYFSIQLQLIGKYQKYQSDYRLHLKEVESRQDKSTINELRKEMKAQSANHSAEIAQLLKATNRVVEQNDEIKEQNEEILDELHETRDELYETKEDLGEVKEELQETKETVKTAMKHLDDKSRESTTNPNDETLHHFFAATVLKRGASRNVKFISGQQSYVGRTVTQHIDAGREMLLEPFYNANGIDLRNNVSTEFKKRRKAIVKAVNAQRKLEVDSFNEQLKSEIKHHNAIHPGERRSFNDEKRRMQRLHEKDIPVDIKTASFDYTINDYISFNEIVELVIKLNGITQTNPLKDDVKTEPAP